MKIKYLTILILSLILILQIALRIPFLQEPLERDEGVYAYVAQRMLAGEVPYRDVFDHKPPAVYFIYAGIFKFFGESLAAIRISALFFSLVTTLSVFAVGALLWGSGAGLLSAFLYGLFSGGAYIHGSSANTETFMVLPMVLALLFFVVGSRQRGTGSWGWFLGAGLFSGMALMLKQVALFNLSILFLFLFGFENRRLRLELKGLLWFLAGCVIVPSLFLLYFTFEGALSDFIYGVLIINKRYLLNVPGNFFSKAVFGFKEITTIAKYENSLIWAFGSIGLLYIFIRDHSRENMLLGLWGAASFVAVSFSGLFFGHYFIQLIPALCLLSAFALKRIKEKVGFYGGAAILLFSILLILFILPVQYLYHFRFSPEEISQHKYRSKDFVVSHQLAREFQNFMKPDETILVWSANPELYFYLKKKAPTKYINYLKWMDDEKIKKEILRSVLDEKPNYIVHTGYGPNYEELIDFVRENYRLFMRVENWMVFRRKW